MNVADPLWMRKQKILRAVLKLRPTPVGDGRVRYAKSVEAGGHIFNLDLILGLPDFYARRLPPIDEYGGIGFDGAEYDGSGQRGELGTHRLGSCELNGGIERLGLMFVRAHLDRVGTGLNLSAELSGIRLALRDHLGSALYDHVCDFGIGENEENAVDAGSG